MCKECCEREVTGNSVQTFVGEQFERLKFRLKYIHIYIYLFKNLNVQWCGVA
jgi:hypothetical protein